MALVGSAPNFPHGIIDNIEALSQLAVKYKLPLHVDCCLGGLLMAFYGSKINIPKFDFLLPGVTSISADFHKYGLAPKGVSVILYRNTEYRKHQYLIYPSFMGGVYPSPSFAGSRSAAMAISALAILLFNGRDRYVNQARMIHEAVLKIKKFVQDKLPRISVIGNPQVIINWN